MPDTIEKALELKQTLVDFVYDAEGEIAVALESYAAEKSQKNSYGIKQQNLIVDLFVTDGEVGEQTPLDIFLSESASLDQQAQQIVSRWHQNFIGLFEIEAIDGNCYQLINWLTAKTYRVYSHSLISEKETSRWQPGEIILTIIAPINEQEWFFFSDRIIKGRLSQPKLAVAIGEFRDRYPEYLYADAPQLLEQAWDSVVVYHEQFVEYFGEDRLSLPGYQLNQKIGELQQKMSDRKLAEAGIDSDKSLAEVLGASGADQAELTATASDLGVDSAEVEKIISSRDKLSMVTPKVDLPPEIKQAQSVTVFSHPRWGQTFLPNLEKFTDILATATPTAEDTELGLRLIAKYLPQPEANYYIWQQLAQKYPQTLETLLQKHTLNSSFSLDRDLDQLLLQHQKSATPELPAIANVPIHLNNLFEAAVAQVQKSKTKSKKKKAKKGFLS